MSNIVCDEGQAWIVHVEPSRDLTVGDKEDLSHPRRMLHERPDRVAQLLNKNSKKKTFNFNRLTACHSATSSLLYLIVLKSV